MKENTTTSNNWKKITTQVNNKVDSSLDVRAKTGKEGNTTSLDANFSRQIFKKRGVKC